MIDVIATFALFASAISVNKLILQALPPMLFVGVRMTAAGLLLVAYHATQQQSHITTQRLRQHGLSLAAIALATTYLSSICKAYGLRYMLSSKVALIGSLDPCITAIYSYVLWGQRLQWHHLLGMAIAIIGVGGMLTIDQYDALAEQWWIFSLPEAAALASVAITRLGWIGVQRFVRDGTFSPAEVNTVMMCIGGVWALGTAYARGEFVYLTSLLSWPYAALMAYTVVVGNIIAYTGYGRLLRRQSVTLVSLSGLLIPLFVHMYGPLITGEPITASFLAALMCVSCGLWLFNRHPLK